MERINICCDLQTVVGILGICGNIVAGFILSRREMRNSFNLLLVTLACFDSTYVSTFSLYEMCWFYFACSCLVVSWRVSESSSTWEVTCTSFSFLIYCIHSHKLPSRGPFSWRLPSLWRGSLLSTTQSTTAKRCMRPMLWPKELSNTWLPSLFSPSFLPSPDSLRLKWNTLKKLTRWQMSLSKRLFWSPLKCAQPPYIPCTSIGVDWSSWESFHSFFWSTSTPWSIRWDLLPFKTSHILQSWTHSTQNVMTLRFSLPIHAFAHKQKPWSHC